MPSGARVKHGEKHRPSAEPARAAGEEQRGHAAGLHFPSLSEVQTGMLGGLQDGMNDQTVAIGFELKSMW
jgi:hypothetical protein